jgi:hypothetical protein
MKGRQIDADGYEHEVDIYCYVKDCGNIADFECVVVKEDVEIEIAVCDKHKKQIVGVD